MGKMRDPSMQKTQETWVRSLGWDDPLDYYYSYTCDTVFPLLYKMAFPHAVVRAERSHSPWFIIQNTQGRAHYLLIALSSDYIRSMSDGKNRAGMDQSASFAYDKQHVSQY